MTKHLWMAFTAIFLIFSIFHFYRATRSIAKAPNTAKVKAINGMNLGIAEFIAGFNSYIDELNRDNRIVNLVTATAYLAAAGTALFSYYLSS